MRTCLVLVGALVAAVVASPIGASESKTTVKIQLKEFKVLASPASAPHWFVMFEVRNTGKIRHEFVVLKTKVAPAKLPVKSGKAVETGRVGKIGALKLKPGAFRMLNLNLEAGKYVLLCNLPGHYQAGQRIGFAVT
jgi:uncharacterized cupredoxin-like copper-binding protein